MTLLWMAYAMALTALFASGAAAAERLAVVWGSSRRVVWLVALVVSAVLPPAILMRRSMARPIEVAAAPVTSVAARGAAAALRVVRARPSPLVVWLRLQARRAERVTRELWAIASLVVAAIFGRSLVALRRRRATWSEELVGDRRVLVAPDVGPAVVGFVRPRIVMPRWALVLDAFERDLMLRHEAEHVRGRDQWSLLFAGVLLALMPWNAAMWWMVRRLRLALEVDCDARVIRGGAPAHEYGLLLLAVGERQTHTLTLAASLTEERPLLERRIHAMITLRPRRPILASIPFATLALVAGVAAAQTPVPDTLARGNVMARAVRAPIVSQEFVRSVIAVHHPSILQGDPEINRVNIVIDRNGEYVSSSASKVELTEVPVGASSAMAGAKAGGTPEVIAATGAVMTARASTAPDVVRSNGEAGNVVARAGAGPMTTAPSAQIFGIDRALTQANGMMSYPAGQIGPNRLTIGWVKLK